MFSAVLIVGYFTTLSISGICIISNCMAFDELLITRDFEGSDYGLIELDMRIILGPTE